jgi:hypothetical protein
MRPTISARTVTLVIAGFFLLALRIAAQSTQEPSIADAARMNRVQKKPSSQPTILLTQHLPPLHLPEPQLRSPLRFQLLLRMPLPHLRNLHYRQRMQKS